MKFFSFFFLSCFFLFLLVSCRPDSCAKIICQNGGTCNEGNCKCADGYAGVNCEIKVNPCFALGCDTTHSSCVVTAGSAHCVCDYGYEGVKCDKTWAEKLFGTYTASGGGCILGGYDIQVIQGTKFNSITIKNFHNRASATFSSKVVCDLLSPYAFKIEPQPLPLNGDTIAIFVEGSGELSQDYKTLNLYYTLRNSSTNDTVRCDNMIFER